MPKRNVRRTYRISKYIIYKETFVDYKEYFWSFVGAFVGIGLIAWVQSQFLTELENIFLIGSFGASSVLIYGAINSPMAQPRNLIGGHLISAAIGVTIGRFMPDVIWVTAPLAVATSIIAMQFTKTLHPPGGATALIAIIGNTKISELGYGYVLSPVLTGTLILFVTALVFNNLTKHRRYPARSKRRFLTRLLRK